MSRDVPARLRAAPKFDDILDGIGRLGNGADRHANPKRQAGEQGVQDQ